MKTQLNFKQPMTTRGGSDIRLYELFSDKYINGAYHERETDIWFPVQWDWNGFYGNNPSSLDLVNISTQEVA